MLIVIATNALLTLVLMKFVFESSRPINTLFARKHRQ